MQLIRYQDLIPCRLGCPSCQWIPTRLKSDKDLTKLEIIAIKSNRKIIDPQRQRDRETERQRQKRTLEVSFDHSVSRMWSPANGWILRNALKRPHEEPLLKVSYSPELQKNETKTALFFLLSTPNSTHSKNLVNRGTNFI